MWKRECNTSERCIAEEKEYLKKRYNKPHKEHELREGYQALVPTLNLNNLKCLKKLRDSFVGPFTIIRLIGENAVEVKIRGILQETTSVPSECSQTIPQDWRRSVPFINKC
ncbi:hypothetical protein O181_010203 [Austropuccinia psidii MF-1]|uniref:Uncharacterized protein n=1 Tax=Austropuccinia psidii MF-1 TaxID=1389203 RepID=A0A9Q3BSW0_9BASI|nr:hypothetical protein [Austropuccinia psidii MF-1]